MKTFHPLSAPLALALSLAPVVSVAQETADEPVQIEDLQIRGEALQDPLLPGGMQSLDEGRIFAGKKATEVDLGEQPAFVDTNLRQMFSRLPGLLVSDQRIPSHYNVNYRGLGDPHESEFVAFFMDTVPLAGDLFGYPTIYFLPPAQRIERIELTRGGSGLLYGPQIGPSVNFVMRGADARAERRLLTEQSLGTDGFYSTYNEARWGNGEFGVMAALDRRQSDGARTNEDFEINSGYLGLDYAGLDRTRIGLDLNVYQSDSGEAGRLTSAEFARTPNTTNTPFNRVKIDRVVAALRWDQQVQDDATFNGRLYYTYLDRFSRRSAPIRGGANPPATTALDRQEYTTYGADGRYSLAWGADHALTLGTTLYRSENPRTRHVSDEIQSDAMRPEDLRFQQDRDMEYAALFLENIFRVGDLSLVPALRYERITYDLFEPVKDPSVQRDAIDLDRTDSELLFGLGSLYQVNPRTEIYTNISESYRPQRFDDLANPNSELAEENGPSVSRAMNYEMGVRSRLLPGLLVDVSLFRVDFEDKIEQIQLNQTDVVRVNTGDSRHQGLEFSAEYQLLGDGEAGRGLTLFMNGSLLDAEIVRSVNASLVGNTPAFAPDYLIRSGFIYDANRLNLALTATFVSDQFWQDSNAARGSGEAQIDAEIPAYEVVDLSAEYALTPRWSLLGGVNNLLGNDYYSRVRADGIDPAADRTAYAGVRLSL